MRQLNIIAREIWENWEKPYFGAVPYLKAMSTLTDINQQYGYDSAESVVRYFLCNASTWRGDTARRVKTELKEMLR